MAIVMRCVAVFGALVLGTGDGSAQSVSTVHFPSADGTMITGYLMRPAGAARRPAVVALHGCGGPLSSRSRRLSKRHLAWGKILVRHGYVVMFPDSFGSRGYGSLCRLKPRPVKQRHRQRDAQGARHWLAAQSFVSSDRIYLLGWSNGGGTALRLAISNRGRGFRNIVAFYPGCRALLKRQGRRPHVPLKILIGAADDWTRPEPCIKLAKRWGISIVLYQGAYHSFDTPNSRLRTRYGMPTSRNPGGTVTLGTNERARRMAIREVLRTFE